MMIAHAMAKRTRVEVLPPPFGSILRPWRWCENVMSSDDFDVVQDDKTSDGCDVIEGDETAGSDSDGVAADVDEPLCKVRRRGAAPIPTTSTGLSCAFVIANGSGTTDC